MIRKTTAACAALTVAASGLLIASANPASAASTYYACVKKSSGETKMVKKNKKCKKGWKKVSWSATGPTGAIGPVGPAGAMGPALTVKDATGAAVGPLMGAWAGLRPGYVVLIDGGAWSYEVNGLLENDGSPNFTDAACTTAVVYVGTGDPAESAQVAAQYAPNSLGREVYRPYAAVPARAWRVTGPNSLVVAGQQLFRIDDPTGNCVLWNTLDADDVTDGDILVGLGAVTPPASRPGPLSVG
jgi:hypothetical protein